MPIIRANNVNIHYQEYGQGEETIVFSHGYLMNHTMYQYQIEQLSKEYRVIAYDHRSHGDSEVVFDTYGIYDLVDDAAALIKGLDLGKVHFAGMSTGGYVGLRLAIKYPELLNSLVLIDTAASSEDPDKQQSYNLLLNIMRYLGPKWIINRILSILMGAKFLNDASRAERKNDWKSYISGLSKKGIYLFGKAIFKRDSVIEQLPSIEVPSLILVGSEDIPTPLSEAELMLEGLPHAQMKVIPDAGHTSPIEEPDLVSKALVDFYDVCVTSNV